MLPQDRVCIVTAAATPRGTGRATARVPAGAMARGPGQDGARANAATPVRTGVADHAASARLRLASDIPARVAGAVPDVDGGMLVH